MEDLNFHSNYKLSTTNIWLSAFSSEKQNKSTWMMIMYNKIWLLYSMWTNINMPNSMQYGEKLAFSYIPIKCPTLDEYLFSFRCYTKRTENFFCWLDGELDDSHTHTPDFRVQKYTTLHYYWGSLLNIWLFSSVDWRLENDREKKNKYNNESVYLYFHPNRCHIQIVCVSVWCFEVKNCS